MRISDWSSDVCSSDLAAAAEGAARRRSEADIAAMRDALGRLDAATDNARDFAEADLDFHEEVGHATGNVLMRSLAAVTETALVASFRKSSPVNTAEAHRASARGNAPHVATGRPRGRGQEHPSRELSGVRW